jgi:hypothetical protein
MGLKVAGSNPAEDGGFYGSIVIELCHVKQHFEACFFSKSSRPCFSPVILLLLYQMALVDESG